jgi:hypothetical protein
MANMKYFIHFLSLSHVNCLIGTFNNQVKVKFHAKQC